MIDPFLSELDLVSELVFHDFSIHNYWSQYAITSVLDSFWFILALFVMNTMLT